MKSKTIAVIGAGVGGLGAALRLSHRGHRVVVFEKNGFIGGRNRRDHVNDAHFDAGPTLLMMLDPFRKLFADVGESFDEHISTVLCDPTYRVFFKDGSRIDGTTRVAEMASRIEALAGKEASDAYPGFLKELKQLYDESIPYFVRKNFGSLSDFASPSQISRVLKNHMLGNLAKRVHAKFSDPKVRMLFTFQTMYLGLSPFDAPWVYATLAYMEYGEGIFYPMGGLPAISEAIARLAEERGTEIRLDSPVKGIDGKNVVLESGEIFEADIVIANADLPYVDRELNNQTSKRELRYSCSAHLMYIDYEGDLPGMEHHNVFFGNDFEGNLRSLFHDFKMPRDPAFYACISAKTESLMAAPGHQNLMLLVPVPNLTHKPTEQEMIILEDEVIQRLVKEVGFEPKRIRGMKRRGPHEWLNELNLDRGAAFGISHDLFQSAFMRPQNRSKSNPNLFYVGASTVPGNGLPMVLISAELVEQRLIDEGLIAA